ncbi:MAG: cupin domain-containing protein [Bdellovibrionales bacterium]|nr:cupin domain-containing protein [Bdellovibrionales bacterium]
MSEDRISDMDMSATIALAKGTKFGGTLFVLTLLAASGCAPTKPSCTPNSLQASIQNRRDVPRYLQPDGNGWVQVLQAPARDTAVPCSGSAVSFAVFKPGAQLAEHLHPESDELLYVVSGSARTKIDGTWKQVEAGDTIVIPKNTPHAMTHNGNEELRVIQVFTPAGPEARYYDWQSESLGISK